MTLPNATSVVILPLAGVPVRAKAAVDPFVHIVGVVIVVVVMNASEKELAAHNVAIATR